MRQLLLLMRGYLRVRINGLSSERFINLCGNKNIMLWNIVHTKAGYEMCISLESFYRLRPIVRKTKTKVVILEKNGLPFLLPFLRRRSTFLIGFLLVVLFWQLSGLFVWHIDFDGNLQVTTNQLEQFLEERQIGAGMLKARLNIGQLEKDIRNTFQSVIWTSAKLDGNRLVIAIKENDAPLQPMEEQAESLGMDLITEREGRIVSMIVRKGVPKVKIGDTVVVNQILVEGKIPIYQDDGTLKEYKYVDADADIILAYPEQLELAMEQDCFVKEYTGRSKTRYTLKLGQNKPLKLPMNKPYLHYDCVVNCNRSALFESLHVPIYLGTETYREYQIVEHRYDLESAKPLLMKKLMIFLQTLEEKGVQIIEKDVTIDTSGCGFRLHGQLGLQEKIEKLSATERGEETLD